MMQLRRPALTVFPIFPQQTLLAAASSHELESRRLNIGTSLNVNADAARSHYEQPAARAPLLSAGSQESTSETQSLIIRLPCARDRSAQPQTYSPEGEEESRSFPTHAARELRTQESTFPHSSPSRTLNTESPLNS